MSQHHTVQGCQPLLKNEQNLVGTIILLE